MACTESRSADTVDGRGDIILGWHDVDTQVFLTVGSLGPCVEIAWTPTPETGVRVYLRLFEAEELADALTAALMTHARLSAENGGEDSGPDWDSSPSPQGTPPVFGSAVWPPEREF
ncbi:hypothetical protein [Nocardia sp. NPDC020380]|uniref:hypothetical protein n=1 Tax=Nocardia sp. NPDC020380 TaxID=3364309 RepID=UPI0037B28450